MSLILPPIFARTEERDKARARYAASPAGRESKKLSHRRRYSHIVQTVEARERARAQAEQRERFLAYRAANPPPARS